MKKENIVRYKADKLPKTSRTDWERLDSMTDEDIDTSEIPELDDECFKGAKMNFPHETKAISFQVDEEVLNWFKSKSKSTDYQIFMNAVLKAFVKKQKELVKK
jgi:uncharacterized protein (DUF4415 family)